MDIIKNDNAFLKQSYAALSIIDSYNSWDTLLYRLVSDSVKFNKLIKEAEENNHISLLQSINLTDDSDLNTLLVMELKRPFIIIALSIVFALPALNKSLLSFIPKLANEAGNMNFLGIIVKAILVGLLYYVLDKCF